MFDKDIIFKGTHGEKVIRLTAKFDEKNQLFKRNLDVYFMAPIVGFLYQRKADCNNGDGSQKTTKIFASDVMKYADDMLFNYRLLILLDKKNTTDIETRVDKVFRYYNSDRTKDDEKIFDQYVLGGVDVLYEKLIESARGAEDYLNNL